MHGIPDAEFEDQKITRVAFHGSGAMLRGEKNGRGGMALCNDMKRFGQLLLSTGCLFPNWRFDNSYLAVICEALDNSVDLVGYSAGAEHTIEVLEMFPEKIRKVISYDGPNRFNVAPAGTCDVMVVWNNKTKQHRANLKQQTNNLWRVNHNVEFVEGQGRHIVRGCHNWNDNLFPKFVNFLFTSRCHMVQ